MPDAESSQEESLEESDDVASYPTNADPKEIVERKIPADILQKYEVYSYKNAAVILSEVRQVEFAEICEALRVFTITTNMIAKSGGNESEMPKLFTALLRPKGWHETTIRGDLEVTLSWREQVETGRGRVDRKRVVRRDRYLDGQKIDYVKGTVAFDMEWNSKDQTFDRDLYAFSAFFLSGAIDVAVLVTRSESLNTIF